MRAPVSLCIIVKDNAAQLGILLRLARDYFAEIVVVDTGSTDATVAVASAVVDKVETFTNCNDSEGRIVNFSAARKRSFDLATQKAILWADSDDEIYGLENLNADVVFLEQLRAQTGKPTILQYDYNYASNSAGLTVLHKRERLLLREDREAFQWEGRVHELLTPSDEANSVRMHRPTMIWNHRQAAASGRNPDRDLRILQYSLEEEGGLAAASLRTIYCLAGEYLQRQRWEEARTTCRGYLVRPGARVERTLLLGYIAKSYLAEKDLAQALTYALDAFGNVQGDELGDIKDPAFTLGLVYKASAETSDTDRRQHALRTAVRFFRMGLEASDRPGLSSSFPQNAITARLGLIECLRALEKHEEALKAVEEALTVAPNTSRFLRHRGELNLITTKNTIVQSIAKLHEWGGVSDGDVAGLAEILNTAPSESQPIQVSPHQPIRDTTGHPIYDLGDVYAEKLPRPGKLDIILACGDTREPWDPRRVEEIGVGGSETAACDWARGMVARGHRVRVFTRCGEPGIYEGVEYLPTTELDNAHGDLAVVWRFPALLPRVHASRVVLWAHDASMPGVQPGTPMVALSQWHKTTLVKQHTLRPEDVTVIGSAIRVEDFADGGIAKRRPHAAVCMSAHERHLMAFIDIWPRIRAAVPDATLDLFYGYDEWKQLLWAGFSEQIRYFDRKRPMLEALGVTFHPRMPPKEIAQKMLRASVWLYPTSWPECWAAVAAQAQAAGLASLTTDIAGLAEVLTDTPDIMLLHGTGAPHGWNLEPGYQDRFVAEATRLLRHPISESQRREMRHRATENFGWQRCLDAWENLFEKLPERSHQEHLDATYTSAFYEDNVSRRDEFDRFGTCVANVLPGERSRTSVLDIGCGAGLLVARLRELGYRAFGFDGSKHAIENAVLKIREFVMQKSITDYVMQKSVTDYTAYRYDYTTCTEVAEHLPEKYADVLVDLIANTTRYRCVWSAAPPGQHGLDHVNLQLPAYWLNRFAAKGLRFHEADTNKLRSEMRFTRSVHAEYANNFYVLDTDTHHACPPTEK